MDAAHAKLLFSHKLMTGVDIPIGGNSYILTACSAAPEPLNHTGALRQVHIKVEEIYILSVHQHLGQSFVLLLYPAQVLFPNGKGVVYRAAAWLHRYMTEAQVSHVEHILSKVQVVPGKGAPDVVVSGI